MKRALLLSMLLGLALASLPARAQSAAPPAGPYRIAGTVVNAATGEPLTGVTVAILNAGDSRTVAAQSSGAEGRFVFEHLPAGKFQLTASRRGFRSSLYDEHGDYNTAIVTGPDQDTGHLVFRLPPGAVLHGVIADDGGDPVEGATVLLFQKGGGDPPDGSIHQVGTAATDDTGSYEFADLAAGTYLLAVRAEPWYAMHSAAPRSTASPLDVAYPITYFDSTTDEVSATPIVLAGGSLRQADIALHAVPALRLQVPVPGGPRSAEAEPELEAMVFGTAMTSQDFPIQTARQGGGVDFTGVPPGRYKLTQGNPQRVAGLVVAASQQVESSAGARTVPVSGSLRMAPGAALPAGLGLTLDPLGGVATSGLGVTAGGDGFRFSAVPAGAWRLRAHADGAALSVISIAADGRVQDGNRIAVEDRPLSLLVTVAAGALRVEGVARRRDKGFAGAMIVLVPQNTALIPELVRRDQSDSDGSFALLNVLPGAYTVVAIEDGWTLDWTRPEALARYLSGGVSVRVTDRPDHLLRLAQPVPVVSR